MTKLILSMPDEKVKTFLNFISDLNYIRIDEKDFSVPAWQKKEVAKRQRKIKSSPSLLVSSKEALKTIKSLRV
jgi:hypothetical protein